MSKSAAAIVTLCFLALCIVFATKSFRQFSAESKLQAAQATQANPINANKAGTFEYAQLSFSNNQVTWVLGNTDVDPVPVNLAQAIRNLGSSRSKATRANLLYAIGQQGWELVIISDGVWIFKRAG